MSRIFATAEPDVLARHIRERACELERPCVVALDGRSSVGKSTLARQLATLLDAALLPGDDFYAGGVEIRHDSPEARAATCIDWRKQRSVLKTLRGGCDAHYFAFDWKAFNNHLEETPTRIPSRSVILFEGVYTARSELRDLVDVRVLLRLEERARISRLLAREGGISAWEQQWQDAETWYFAHAVSPKCFDIILDA